MKIGIIISTYQRKDGKTPFYLNRALESILSQTYKNFKIFLIGDRYENSKEFELYSEKIKSVDHVLINLPVAYERDFYGDNKNALWSYAGTYSTNFALDLCQKEEINFVTTLNHDDWWYENHLQEFFKCYEKFGCDFMCTQSTFANPNNKLPNFNSSEEYIFFNPLSCGLIHSSAIVNIKKIPLRYIDLFKENGAIGLPGDADYWERVRAKMTQDRLCGIFINKLTCRHDEEGYEKK